MRDIIVDLHLSEKLSSKHKEIFKGEEKQSYGKVKFSSPIRSAIYFHCLCGHDSNHSLKEGVKAKYSRQKLGFEKPRLAGNI